MMTGHICTTMLQKVSWGNKEMAEKVMIAALLADISLSQSDFEELAKNRNNPDKLNKNCYSHPVVIAQKLSAKSSLFAIETITIIRQHHERPSGKGFPGKLKAQQIAPLSAVYIVGAYFVEKMFGIEFNEADEDERKENLLSEIENIFYQGQFKKAAAALREAVS